MRRLAASLFGRRDDKKQPKDGESVPKPALNTPLGPKLRPFYVSPPSNSSASSSTSFSVLTPEDGSPPSLAVAGTPRGWKSVFRSRKGSMSTTSLARRQSTVAQGSGTKTLPASALARSRTFTDTSPAYTDDEDDLSPPVRPFVRHRSSRSSERSSSYTTNSPSSSRSSLLPQLPPIPASPPPLTPSVYMQAVIIRSLSRNPYTSPHPLLTFPITNVNTSNPSAASSEISLYPRSVNAAGALPPPILTLPRHLARIRLLERLKSHVFTPIEERAVLRASSLFRLSVQSTPGAGPAVPSRQAPSLQITAGQQTPQEVEATQIHRIDRSGVSRGLARWVRRGGFEERCVIWTIDESRREYVSVPVQGNPVAALEFSEGMEAFAGLIETDEAVTDVTSATARSSSHSSLSPYTLPSVNDLLAASTSISLSNRSSSASSGIPSTPALSAAPSSPTPSSISLSPAMAVAGRSAPTSYIAPAQASTLQRVPSLPKRRGVRFAPTVISSSPPSTPLNGGRPQSSSEQIHVPVSDKNGPSPDRSSKRRSNASGWGGPVVIVHPSTPADELEIDAPPPSPGSRTQTSKFGAAGPKDQRASVTGANAAQVPFTQHDIDREREERERELYERERRRKSSLTAQQRLHDEVIAARKRRESYKLDGGSTSNRAQAALAADSSSFSYSSTNSSSNSSLGGLKPPARRTTTEPGSLGRKGRGQMWDISVDDTPSSPTASTSSYSSHVSLHTGGSGGNQAPGRPPSLRSIATMHGTGTNANQAHGTSGQRKASSGNLRTMMSSNHSRASLPATAPNGASPARASGSRTASMSMSGPGAGVGGSGASSHGTTNGASNASGSLPRRRSVATGDVQQYPPSVPTQSRDSNAAGTRRASVTSVGVPSMPMQQMYGVPYGMQMQMPMVVVQPVAVPFYVPVDSNNMPVTSQNTGPSMASRPASTHSAISSYPRPSHPLSRSSHSRSQSQHTLQQQHISPSSSSTTPSPYTQQSASASASHSLLSLSRSHSQSHLHRQSITPPPPVPQRRHPPLANQ